jgi:hypothetical protein
MKMRKIGGKMAKIVKISEESDVAISISLAKEMKYGVIMAKLKIKLAQRWLALAGSVWRNIMSAIMKMKWRHQWRQ